MDAENDATGAEEYLRNAVHNRSDDTAPPPPPSPRVAKVLNSQGKFRG